MSRYLLLTLDFPPRRGGVARYLDALATTLQSDLRVLAEPEPGSRTFDETAPYPIERRSLLFRFFWPRWKKIVLLLLRRWKTYRIVLVSHVLPLGASAWIARWVTRRPYVVFVHGMDIGLVKQNGMKRWLAGRVLRAAALVVANSHALAEEVQQDFGVHKISITYPCVSPSLGLSQTSTKIRLDETLTLLTVARLVPRKGHLRVLEAMTYLFHMAPLGSVCYHIVGDGPMYKEIVQRTRELGIEDYVTIDRNLNDQEREKAYAEADIFVMPTLVSDTDREGFGLVYLESALHGLPSIATKQPGVDEAILDGETGVLVEDGDITALANAIARLGSDRTLRERLGAQARERALAEFTCYVQFGRLRQLLDRL